MEEFNDKEKLNENSLIEVAMQIILHAGDARNFAVQAVNEAKKGNSKESEALMSEAEKSIVKAHEVQTNIIQDTMRGVNYEYNILFIHAQDTLMTIKSELAMYNELIEIHEMFKTLTKGQNNGK